MLIQASFLLVLGIRRLVSAHRLFSGAQEAGPGLALFPAGPGSCAVLSVLQHGASPGKTGSVRGPPTTARGPVPGSAGPTPAQTGIGLTHPIPEGALGSPPMAAEPKDKSPLSSDQQGKPCQAGRRPGEHHRHLA